jgi:hypothetical protein
MTTCDLAVLTYCTLDKKNTNINNFGGLKLSKWPLQSTAVRLFQTYNMNMIF